LILKEHPAEEVNKWWIVKDAFELVQVLFENYVVKFASDVVDAFRDIAVE
jgi:hypothetical protein